MISYITFWFVVCRKQWLPLTGCATVARIILRGAEEKNE